MSFLSSIFGDDENAARGEAADASLRQINEASTAAGRYSQDAQDRIANNYGSQNTIGVDAQSREIDAAFGEGWNDGKKNVTGFVGGIFKTAGDVLGSVLLGIPFWVWAIAAVGVWGWLGFPGLSRLKKKFA